MDRIADCHFRPWRPPASSKVRIYKRGSDQSRRNLREVKAAYLPLEIASQLPLLLTSTSRDEIQIDLTSDRIRLSRYRISYVSVETADD
jgi:hypothetical protein